MTKTKLKPCPFCGGEATLIYADDKTWQVVCDSCGSCSDYYDEEWDPDNPPEGNEAASAWNSRPIEDKKDEEIKRIQRALEEINKLVKDTQEAVYIFPVDLDDKYKAHILEVLEEALEGKKA